MADLQQIDVDGAIREMAGRLEETVAAVMESVKDFRRLAGAEVPCVAAPLNEVANHMEEGAASFELAIAELRIAAVAARGEPPADPNADRRLYDMTAPKDRPS